MWTAMSAGSSSTEDVAATQTGSRRRRSAMLSAQVQTSSNAYYLKFNLSSPINVE